MLLQDLEVIKNNDKYTELFIIYKCYWAIINYKKK